MNRVADATAPQGSDSPGEGRGWAYALGWRVFLAFVALTPLVIGALPPQVGPLARFIAYDPVSLPKTVVFLVLSGVVLAALCVSALRGEVRLRWHPVLWVVVGLVGWAVVSTLFSASPALSVLGSSLRNEGLVAIFGYGLVAFLAVQYVRSTRDIRAVLITAVVSGSLVSAYALLQFFGLDPIAWTNVSGRVWSTFGNADMLGDYLVFPFVLALGLALSTHRRWISLAWWSAAALAAVALVLTQTRGAWIAVFVGVVCMGWASWRGARHALRRPKLVFGALAVALVAAAVGAIALARRGAGASPTSLASTLARVSNGRTVIWLTGLRAWLVHPITGWGPDGFQRAFESAVGADWYAVLAAVRVPYGSADNAHSFLVQALVTLGIPGLVLTVWALGQTAVQSFRGLQSVKGPALVLMSALWGALIGMIVALSLGVTTPEVSVWLWLAAGLLLAPMSHAVVAPPKAVLAAGAGIGIAIALYAGSWLVADVYVGWAMQQQPGPVQLSALQTAVRLNPLSGNYRGLVADALANEAIAEQSAGQSPQSVDATMQQALAAYAAAADADRGDMLVRVAYANALLSFATVHPGSDAAQSAVRVALEAVALAPHDGIALVTLARAYQVAGRLGRCREDRATCPLDCPSVLYADPRLARRGEHFHSVARRTDEPA